MVDGDNSLRLDWGRDIHQMSGLPYENILLELLGDISVSKSIRSIPVLVHIAHEWMKMFQRYIHCEWTIIPPYISALCNWNTIEGIDLIHDARHLCTRSRIDGIKAMSHGFSGGKQVTKFASTSNRGWVCLFYQNETTISWSCKTYVSSFGKIYVITVCHEDIYGRYCTQKSNNDHFHSCFDIIIFKIKRVSFPVV